ncbi:MAG TPA: ATP-dependent DNA ligase [Gemmataceae bacterium]|nr:ATP-dependent DNA ligase [Gemmataceae bacterium]
MKLFADLYAALDETNKTSAKVAALARYFAVAPPADAAWAVFFLTGRKPRQVVPSRKLREWAIEAAGLPDWLFDESYHAVGDAAETISLLLAEPTGSAPEPLHWWVEEVLLPLRKMEEAEQRVTLVRAWKEMDRRQRFVWNKLITGEFRVGVSHLLVTRALAGVSGLPSATVAHRLMGDWSPTPEFYQRLVGPEDGAVEASRPYPFFLAYPLEAEPHTLGPVSDWQAEWKWDGIRSQLIRRAGQTFLWSRGEELVTERYPELRAVGDALPDGTVIDGEILPWSDRGVQPFAQLQRRIGRKTLGKKLLAEVPVILLAYDLLEAGGADTRGRPLEERRARLESIVNDWRAAGFTPAEGLFPSLQLSPVIDAASWEDLTRLRLESRSRNVEGLMLKRHGSPYRVGRQRGDWWKWKIHPHTIDAVLITAQRGSGKRASLYTDYTFGLWDNDKLVPVAKAYSGLTDAEIREVDAFVRRHTVEKFGPVRSVRPELVFELAFEGIQRSTRHKSGVAVRFPRILRWRTDKPAAEADTLETLKAMLPPIAEPEA